ncbi:MAG: amidohydrolase family protein [SAR324 cluster bacterium]|nr:amidohydrolase family protein [SAR324 cluster bacterium]
MFDKIFIKNVNIIDGLGNEPFQGSVFVENKRICKIYKSKTSLPQSGKSDSSLHIVDGKGNYLMPGIIDAHCHSSFDEVSSNDELFFHRNRPGLAAIIASKNLKKILRAGVTSICDPDSIHELGYDLKEAINTSVIQGPRIATGGYAMLTSVGGTAGRLIPDKGTIGYGKIVNGHDEIVAEVRRQIKMGADWIKVHVTGLIPNHKERGEIQVWSREEMELICKVAHDLGTPVMGHCRGSNSIRDAAISGLDLILHGTLMENDALEAVVERKTPIAPTFTFQANLIDYGHFVGASNYIKDLFRREIIDSAVMLRKAYDQGVPILCGTESGFSVTPYGQWHYREMEILMKEMGFTALEAIKSSTSVNAYAMRLEGEIGRVEEGAFADLIIVSADPIKDITSLGDQENIKMVMKSGEIQEFEEEKNRLSIPGWRVVNYGQILSKDLVNKK